MDTYLNVLTAQNDLLNSQLSEITVRTNQLTSSALLITALGGGWDAGQLPSAKQVQQRN